MTIAVHPIPLLDIIVPETHRPVDQGKVEQLSASIRQVGLLQPIAVRQIAKGAYYDKILVFGHHRLEAVRLLGWKTIQARVLPDMSEVDARLWEISENLHRHELTVLERANQIDEWRKLTAEKVRKVSDPSGGAQPKDKGNSATARDLGIDEKEVRNLGKIAGLADEAKEAAVAAGLDDNQNALLKVAAAENQVEAVAEIAKAKAEKPKLSYIYRKLMKEKKAKKVLPTKIDRQKDETEPEVVKRVVASAALKMLETERPYTPAVLFACIVPTLDTMSDADVREFSSAVTGYPIDRPEPLKAAA